MRICLKYMVGAMALTVGIVASGCASSNADQDGATGGTVGSSSGGTVGSSSGGTVGSSSGGTVGSSSGGMTGVTLPGSASSGCGTPAAAGYTNEMLDVGGGSRTFAVNVPEGYSSDRALSLVLVYHGVGVSAGPTRDYFGKSLERAAGADALIVYAEARAETRNAWVAADDAEYEYFDALYAHLTENYCIDTNKVFATGFSNGAQMTNGLRCKRSDVLRGVAPVAGGEAFNSTLVRGGMTPAECGKTAVWIAHATNDGASDFVLGEETRDAVVATNGCSATSTGLTTDAACTTFYEYEGCGPYPVRWCEHDRDHHYDGLHASKVWDFFSSLEPLE